MNKATKVGKVISIIDQKTAAVDVTSLIKHPVYGKYMRRNRKFLVENTYGALINDVVEIEHGKFSKLKTAKVIRVVRAAHRHDVQIGGQ